LNDVYDKCYAKICTVAKSENAMKILYVGYRDDNHSKYGGYDHIAQYPESDFLDAKNVPFGFIPSGRRGKRINLFFLDIISRVKRYKYDIVHLIYGDSQLLSAHGKNIKHKIVITMHLKIQDMTPKKIEYLKKMDGVIVLSSEQYFYAKKIGFNAYFVPHGFDKPTYNSLLPICKNNRTLDFSKINVFFSGTMYRNYDILYHFVNLIKNRNDIVIHVLGQKNNEKARLVDYNNVIIWERLSDDQYYSLLSMCDYNLLPLLFSTANNALMEAQNLGIRTIISDIEGVRDYACCDGNLFFKDKYDLEKIVFILKKEFQSDTIIKHAQKYYWKNIYMQLQKLYIDLFKD